MRTRRGRHRRRGQRRRASTTSTNAGLEALKRKQNVRILVDGERRRDVDAHHYKRVLGGLLVQDPDTDIEDREGWKVVAGAPSEKQWGRVSAVSVDSGKIAWKLDTAQPLIGGGLTTAGGLFFFGEGNGSFNALDSATGKKLWSFNCGAGANAQPVSYMVRGKQYVAMGCGGNTQIDFKRGNSVLVFSLTD